jgi:chaperonin GroEL (HSP60 family)
MTHKQVLFRAEARQKIAQGVHALADAVGVTLGPRSKAVLVGRSWGVPLVCDDGVTIAKEFSLPDPEADLGAQMIRQAAVKTGDSVGDGTTTSILLARTIVDEGLRNIAAGASAIEIKRGLATGLATVVATLGKLSRPVENRRERAQVATISGHGDPQLGELVAEAMEEGIVPGGGWSLLRCIDAVEALEDELDGGEKTGVRILRRALETPTRRIAENSDVDDGVVVDRVRRSDGTMGFDAATGSYVDLLEAGIVDPTKVVRVALENAVSVASVLLLTDATLTEIPDPPATPRGPDEYPA